MPIALYETYRITYSIKLHGKIFTIERKIAKFVKVFPLESFAVYGSNNTEDICMADSGMF